MTSAEYELIQKSAINSQLTTLWENVRSRVQELRDELKAMKKYDRGAFKQRSFANVQYRLPQLHRFPTEISELLRLLQNASSSISTEFLENRAHS